MINVGVAGSGYWGKNIVRVFSQLNSCCLKGVCDASEEVRNRLKSQYPGVDIFDDFDKFVNSPDFDAIIVVTPAKTHADLACKALKAGKHVFVEKPLALNYEDGEKVVKLAEEKGLILMAGHLLLFHPCVDKLKDLIDSGELGNVLYIYSQRVNLGMVRQDENALWSLAPHDISVILHLLKDKPVSVSARGASYLRKDIQDVVFANIEFANGTMAQIQVSWLDPHKIRKFTVVGDKKMVTFDDMEPNEKIRIYDKGADTSLDYENVGELVKLRFGDISIPKTPTGEPLKIEAEHFINSIAENKQPLSAGREGLVVLQVLEAAEKSMRQGGQPVKL